MPGKAEPESKAAIKRAIETIVLNQGNDFIKELMREQKNKNGKNSQIRIGTNKAEFEENLNAAISSGELTFEDIERWIVEVEGWGDQHVYLFSAAEIAHTKNKEKIQTSPYRDLLNRQVSYRFPEELELTTIFANRRQLSMTWHISNTGWIRDKTQDEKKTIGLDTYRLDAYRMRLDRHVVRFESSVKDEYCALFLQLPNNGDFHQAAIRNVAKHLADIGILKRLHPLSLTNAVMNVELDRKTVVHSTKHTTAGGYVEFASTLADSGIEAIEPLRHVRHAVESTAFHQADGHFKYSQENLPKLSKPLRIHVFGSEGRVRIWAQCQREDVYAILNKIWRDNVGQV